VERTAHEKGGGREGTWKQQAGNPKEEGKRGNQLDRYLNSLPFPVVYSINKGGGQADVLENIEKRGTGKGAR